MTVEASYLPMGAVDVIHFTEYIARVADLRCPRRKKEKTEQARLTVMLALLGADN